MEYIEGVDLIEFLRCKGALRESMARHIFKPLVLALKHIHSNGLVHRDIKSDNIMITDNCSPKLLDFGFAADVAGDDMNGFFTTKIGTPEYMAPEMHEGVPYRGTQSDVFALAIVLFQMVLGLRPFEEARKNDNRYKCIILNRPDIFWRMHLRALPKSTVLSEEFKDLIVRMFQPTPEKRLTLDQVLAHKWIQMGEDPEPEELIAEFKDRLTII